MEQNISQILNIMIPKNISYIVCANIKNHKETFTGSPSHSVIECRKCGEFICGNCSSINNENV